MFDIEHIKRSGHSSTDKNHFHAFYEIYYLLNGERYFFIEDRTYRIQKGCLLFIDKYKLHKSYHNGLADYERVVVNFDDDFIEQGTDSLNEALLRPLRGQTKVLGLNVHQQNLVETLLLGMNKQFSLPGTRTNLYIKALLMQLLVFASRLMEPTAEEHVSLSPMNAKINEIVDYIHEHYMTPISLSHVAREFYISAGHLSRTFKQVTGFSFIEYLNSVRIREAQRLLRETDWKIIQVAEQVGFDNISHFGRVYRQITNMSPLAYRKFVHRQQAAFNE